MGNAFDGADVLRGDNYYRTGIFLRLYRQHLAQMERLGLLFRAGKLTRADMPKILGDLVFCFADCDTA